NINSAFFVRSKFTGIESKNTYSSENCPICSISFANHSKRLPSATLIKTVSEIFGNRYLLINVSKPDSTLLQAVDQVHPLACPPLKLSLLYSLSASIAIDVVGFAINCYLLVRYEFFARIHLLIFDSLS